MEFAPVRLARPLLAGHAGTKELAQQSMAAAGGAKTHNVHGNMASKSAERRTIRDKRGAWSYLKPDPKNRMICLIGK
jgi:hypothetical protein